MTSAYLWLPFTLLPIYAALERCRARSSRRPATWGARMVHVRRVVFPLIVPGMRGFVLLVSLTLGDYIVPELWGTRRSSAT